MNEKDAQLIKLGPAEMVVTGVRRGFEAILMATEKFGYANEKTLNLLKAWEGAFEALNIAEKVNLGLAWRRHLSKKYQGERAGIFLEMMYYLDPDEAPDLYAWGETLWQNLRPDMVKSALAKCGSVKNSPHAKRAQNNIEEKVPCRGFDHFVNNAQQGETKDGKAYNDVFMVESILQTLQEALLNENSDIRRKMVSRMVEWNERRLEEEQKQEVRALIVICLTSSLERRARSFCSAGFDLGDWYAKNKRRIKAKLKSGIVLELPKDLSEKEVADWVGALNPEKLEEASEVLEAIESSLLESAKQIIAEDFKNFLRTEFGILFNNQPEAVSALTEFWQEAPVKIGELKQWEIDEFSDYIEGLEESKIEAARLSIENMKAYLLDRAEKLKQEMEAAKKSASNAGGRSEKAGESEVGKSRSNEMMLGFREFLKAFFALFPNDDNNNKAKERLTTLWNKLRVGTIFENVKHTELAAWIKNNNDSTKQVALEEMQSKLLEAEKKQIMQTNFVAFFNRFLECFDSNSQAGMKLLKEKWGSQIDGSMERDITSVTTWIDALQAEELDNARIELEKIQNILLKEALELTRAEEEGKLEAEGEFIVMMGLPLLEQLTPGEMHRRFIAVPPPPREDIKERAKRKALHRLASKFLEDCSLISSWEQYLPLLRVSGEMVSGSNLEAGDQTDILAAQRDLNRIYPLMKETALSKELGEESKKRQISSYERHTESMNEAMGVLFEILIGYAINHLTPDEINEFLTTSNPNHFGKGFGPVVSAMTNKQIKELKELIKREKEEAEAEELGEVMGIDLIEKIGLTNEFFERLTGDPKERAEQTICEYRKLKYTPARVRQIRGVISRKLKESEDEEPENKKYLSILNESLAKIWAEARFGEISMAKKGSHLKMMGEYDVQVRSADENEYRDSLVKEFKEYLSHGEGWLAQRLAGIPEINPILLPKEHRQAFIEAQEVVKKEYQTFKKFIADENDLNQKADAINAAIETNKKLNTSLENAIEILIIYVETALLNPEPGRNIESKHFRAIRRILPEEKRIKVEEKIETHQTANAILKHLRDIDDAEELEGKLEALSQNKNHEGPLSKLKSEQQQEVIEMIFRDLDLSQHRLNVLEMTYLIRGAELDDDFFQKMDLEIQAADDTNAPVRKKTLDLKKLKAKLKNRAEELKGESGLNEFEVSSLRSMLEEKKENRIFKGWQKLMGEIKDLADKERREKYFLKFYQKEIILM